MWVVVSTANLSRVLAEGPTQPPVPANRTQRRAATRKRRLPLALLLVPVVLAAIVAGLILFLRGDGGGILGGNDESNEVPAFDFRLGRTQAIATADVPDEEALDAEADAVAQEVAPVIDELYTDAYLDPSNWREGDYGDIFGLFSNGAAASAEEGIETITLGADAGNVYDRVTPRKGSLGFTVLFDPAGNPSTVAVKVRFYALGDRKDGTFTSIVSAGQMILQDLDGWQITAFDLRRNDRETEPPTPAPSASASASVSASS